MTDWLYLPVFQGFLNVPKIQNMDKEQKDLGKLAEMLRETFSEEELREMRNFLARIADLLVEAYLDGDLS
jgi:hypothetical protein